MLEIAKKERDDGPCSWNLQVDGLKSKNRIIELLPPFFSAGYRDFSWFQLSFSGSTGAIVHWAITTGDASMKLPWKFALVRDSFEAESQKMKRAMLYVTIDVNDLLLCGLASQLCIVWAYLPVKLLYRKPQLIIQTMSTVQNKVYK